LDTKVISQLNFAQKIDFSAQSRIFCAQTGTFSENKQLSSFKTNSGYGFIFAWRLCL